MKGVLFQTDTRCALRMMEDIILFCKYALALQFRLVQCRVLTAGDLLLECEFVEEQNSRMEVKTSRETFAYKISRESFNRALEGT